MRIWQPAAGTAPGVAETAGKRLESIKPGDSFEAEVVASDENGVRLKLADGTELTARRSSSGDLPRGETLTFTVTSRSGGQLTVALTDPSVAGQNVDTSKLLNAFGAARTPANAALLAEMLAGGLTPSKETFGALSALISRFPGLTPQQAVFMTRENIPVTPQNIEQFQAFLEHGNLIGDQLQEILQILDGFASEDAAPASARDAGGGLQPPAPSGQSPASPEQPSAPLNQAAPDEILRAHAGEQGGEIAQTHGDTVAAQAANTPQAADPAQATDTAQAANPAQAADVAQTVNTTQAADPAQAANPTQTADTAQTAATAQAARPLAQYASGTQNAGNGAPPSETPSARGALEAAPQPALTGESDVPRQLEAQTRYGEPAARSAPADAQTPEQAARTAAQPDARGAPRPDGNTDVLRSGAERAVQETKDVGNLIASLFRKVDPSRAHRLPREMNARALSRELNHAITMLREKEASMPESARERLQSAVSDLEQSARFLSRLSSYTPVVGVPLQWGGDRTTAELYVFNDTQGGKKIDPQNATVFLSLMTSNTGRVETLIKVLGKNVECDFKMEDGEGVELARSGLSELSELLEGQGFHLARTSVRESGKTSDLFDVSKARAMNMPKYFFDRTV